MALGFLDIGSAAGLPALFTPTPAAARRTLEFFTANIRNPITEYLRNGGKQEVAQQMANHESARKTGLYDRRQDQVLLDEVERF